MGSDRFVTTIRAENSIMVFGKFIYIVIMVYNGILDNHDMLLEVIFILNSRYLDIRPSNRPATQTVLGGQFELVGDCSVCRWTVSSSQ